MSIDFCIIALSLCLLVTAILWKWWWKKPHPKFPPGPRGVPLIGVLPWLGDYPERMFKKWSMEKYGPIMSARFGMEDVVVLNTFQVIHQALVKNGAYFSGRPPVKLYAQLLSANGIAFSDFHENFRTQKKFLVNTLKKFGQGKKEMERAINNETDYFMEHLQTKLEKPIKIKTEALYMSGNIICKFIFGQRFDYGGSSFHNVFDTMTEPYSDPQFTTIVGALFFFYDYLQHLPHFSTVKERIKKSDIVMMGGIRPFIKQHKESHDPNHIRDYMDEFIYEQTLGKDSTFSDEQLETTVRDLFGAGSETTSTAISWMVLALLLYPDCQEKIVEEIDRVIGPAEWPSMSKKSEMPFTCAFIQEVQRYNATVPQSIIHCAQSDVDFEGYHIPKGTKIIPNLWGAHFDPETWKDPMVFDPYRHIDGEGKFILSSKVISFGIGPRFCPGENMARMEMFLTLTKLLQRFSLHGTGEPLPDLLSGLTSLAHSPRKYEVLLKLR